MRARLWALSPSRCSNCAAPTRMSRTAARRTACDDASVRRAQRSVTSAARTGSPPPRALDDFQRAAERAAFARPARAAEHFLCRLAPDPLRRETLDQDTRGAERAAFVSTTGTPPGRGPAPGCPARAAPRGAG